MAHAGASGLALHKARSEMGNVRLSRASAPPINRYATPTGDPLLPSRPIARMSPCARTTRRSHGPSMTWKIA
jgi:hypothetical protein